jgi:DNA invertase Pin-like site-specific DNA recombinase
LPAFVEGAIIMDKVKPSHLRRKAYLYIRQSTMTQVYHHQESLERQYALQERALPLGWAQEQVEIIDRDLGQSGSSAEERGGFQQLMADVSLGRVGIVMALEVSRLARKCSDWYRLVEYCILTGTLLLDEDGLYDLSDFNDKIILGMKGTVSEIELHMLQARMRGGLLNKARRGELRKLLPVGFVYDEAGRIRLDPPRSGPAGTGSSTVVLRNLPSPGHGLRNSQAFPPSGDRFSSSPSPGFPQATAELGRVDTPPCSTDPEKSPLCRSLFLWEQSGSSLPGRQNRHGGAAPGRVDCVYQRRPFRLHYFRGIRGK